MPIKINGSSSGYTEIKAADAAANNTLTLPSASGTLMTTGGSNTFTSNQIIEVTDNTNAALRITQLGTGEAIRVEDSTNPDSTPFVVDASGNVGIGKSPSYKLDVAAQANLNGVTIGANGDTVNGSSGLLAIQTGGTERMRIDSSGNVGIGTSSPIGRLHVNSATESAVRITSDLTGVTSTDGLFFGLNNNGTDATLWNYENGYLRFATNSTERMRIDASGNVGVGVTSMSDKFQVAGNIRSSGSDAGVLSVATTGTASLAAVSNSRYWRWITSNSDNALRLNDETAGVERMRIDLNGYVMLGVTSSTGSRLVARKDSASGYGTANVELYSASGDPILGFHAAGNTAACIDHSRGSAGVRVVSADRSSYAPIAASAFNVSSDYRLKEDITPLVNASDRVMSIPVYRFKFKSASESGMDYGQSHVDGFMAHEVQDVVPEAITGEKDAINADGKPIYQSIDQSKLVPLLTAALQEALTEIADLKTRLTALEGGAA